VDSGASTLLVRYSALIRGLALPNQVAKRYLPRPVIILRLIVEVLIVPSVLRSQVAQP